LGVLVILAPTINWPASLCEPPAVVLPLIVDQFGAVSAGYLSYLVDALALIPLAIALRDALRIKGSMGARDCDIPHARWLCQGAWHHPVAVPDAGPSDGLHQLRRHSFDKGCHRRRLRAVSVPVAKAS